MTPDELKQKETAFDDAVRTLYANTKVDAEPIFDGVFNPEHYLKAPVRVLWILKEPWCKENGTGGGWSLRDLINDRPAEMANRRTYKRIAYVSHGIINGIWSFQDMPAINVVAGTLRSIAHINVSKMPGLKRTSFNPDVLNAYHSSKKIILEQIEAYKPDFILGCRPHMPFIIQELGGKPETASPSWIAHAKSGNQILLDVYHPCYWGIGHERYVNDILKVISQLKA